MTMDQEDKCDGGEGSWAGYQAELSQSSGVVSLPSTNKLADISLTSDVTDSDIDDEETVLGRNECDHLEESYVGNICSGSDIVSAHKISTMNEQKINVKSDEARHTPSNVVPVSDSSLPSVSWSHNFPSVKQHVFHSGRTQKYSNTSSLSLGDVKEALQENGELFTDQYFLDDLLKSLDMKMQQELIVDSNNPIARYNSCALTNVEPNRDPGLSVGYETEVRTCISKVTDSEQNVSNVHQIQEPSFDQLISSSSFSDHLDKKDTVHCNAAKSPVVSNESLPFSTSTETKHVKFEDSMEELHVCDGMNGTEQQQSIPSYSALTSSIIRQLSGLRWGLEGWEVLSSNPPTEGTSFLPIFHQLLLKLQVYQLENKHLENELAACRTALQELHKTRAVECGMHGQREARLMAVNRELGDLHKEWVVTQKTAVAQLSTLKDQCHQLKEERGIMQKEVMSLKSEVARLKETVKDYDKLKINFEESEEQFANSKRQVAEIAEENSRVNLSILEKKQKLKQLEEVRIPELVQEVEDTRKEVRQLNETNNQLVQARRVIVDEMRIIKLQHQALLARVVAEEQEKEDLARQKAVLASEVKQAKDKVVTIKKEICQHYQDQMEALVAKKTAQLQEQLAKLEKQMKSNLDEQLDAERQSHHTACVTMQQRHEKQIQELEKSHLEVLDGLKQALKKVDEENWRMKEQQQGVLSAVTSIMGVTHQDFALLESAVAKDFNASSKLPRGSETAGSTTRQPKTSCSGSRQGSGQGIRSIPVPTLGLKNSSSSDSEGSVFLDGGQTVRYGAGDQLQTNTTNSSCPTSEFSELQSVCANGSLNINYSCENVETYDYNKSEKQFLSMPDHLNENSLYARKLSKSSSLSLRKTGINACGNNKKNDYGSCDEVYSSVKRINNNCAPVFKQRLFKASDILASDLTEDEQETGVTFAQSQNGEDQHIARAIEKIRQECDAKVEVIPGELQGDQDPASVTLQKLDHVSSLLSQYVTQAE